MIPDQQVSERKEKADNVVFFLESSKAIIKNVLGKTQAEVKEKLKKAIAESGELDIKRSGMYTVGE